MRTVIPTIHLAPWIINLIEKPANYQFMYTNRKKSPPNSRKITPLYCENSAAAHLRLHQPPYRCSRAGERIGNQVAAFRVSPSALIVDTTSPLPPLLCARLFAFARRMHELAIGSAEGNMYTQEKCLRLAGEWVGSWLGGWRFWMKKKLKGILYRV